MAPHSQVELTLEFLHLLGVVLLLGFHLRLVFTIPLLSLFARPLEVSQSLRQESLLLLELRATEQGCALHITAALLYADHALLHLVQLAHELILLARRLGVQVMLGLLSLGLQVQNVLLHHLLTHFDLCLLGLQLRNTHQEVVLITEAL